MGELFTWPGLRMAAWAGLCLVVGAVGYGLVRLVRLDRRQKKLLLKRHLRHAWRWLEERGLVEKNPALIPDYHGLYPELAVLERNFATIQKECRELMASAQAIPPIRVAGGPYTTRGIHEADWRTYWLKAGRFLEPNCSRAPETARMLAAIPGLTNAFFSILGPNQRLRAHWGYYKGFYRYHLGLVVPDDNRDRLCWLRVNDDRRAYDKRIRRVIEETPKYYWHEGEGVVFDDTYLHDAANESDSPRAVLFLDLRRPLPWYLHWPNVLFIALAQLDPTVRTIRRDAIVR